MFHDFQLSNTESGLRFDIKLEPDRRAYVFIGENGVGKTSLIESLGQVVWYCHAMWRLKRGGGSSFRDLVRRKKVHERFKDRTLRVPDAKVDGHDVKQGVEWGFAPMVENAGKHDFGSWVVDRPFVIVPAHQRATVGNIGPASLALVGDAEDMWLDALRRGIAAVGREPIDVATVSAWIASRLLVNPQFVVGLRPLHEEVVVLFELLERFDRGAFNGLVRHDLGGPTRFNVAYKDGKLLFAGRPIDRLASGWIALVKILQEVVSSIAAWEAMRNSTDILGSDALIFVDEIDAHLHPRWQRNLVPFLKDAFPNATFVLTTHSPLVVRDTAPGEAYELVRDGDTVTARKLGSPRDWYFSDILSDAFHVDLAAPGTEGERPLVDLILDFSAAVKAYTTSREEDVRARALALYGEIVPRIPDDDPRLGTLRHLAELLR